MYPNYKNTLIDDLKWMLPDNETIVSLKTQNLENIKILENKSLLIFNASKHDFGVYTCIVNTKSGDRFFRYVFFSNGSFYFCSLK